MPAVICPCCVRPSAWPLWAYSYSVWLTHLERIAGSAMRVERVMLPMQGRNVVLIARPLYYR